MVTIRQNPKGPTSIFQHLFPSVPLLPELDVRDAESPDEKLFWEKLRRSSRDLRLPRSTPQLHQRPRGGVRRCECRELCHSKGLPGGSCLVSVFEAALV